MYDGDVMHKQPQGLLEKNCEIPKMYTQQHERERKKRDGGNWLPGLGQTSVRHSHTITEQECLVRTERISG